MAIEAYAEKNCSIAKPLSFLGERWTVLVLRDLFLGRRRFDEFQSSLGVATNVLSQRLATLTEEGIVERRRYSEHPERFEYVLTEKGRDLQPVLLALLAWGDRYTAENGPPLELVHGDHPSTRSRPARSAASRSTPTTSTAVPARAPTRNSGAPTAAAPPRGSRTDRRLRLLAAARSASELLEEGWAVRGTSRTRRGWRRSKRPGSSPPAPTRSARRRSSTWSPTSPS